MSAFCALLFRKKQVCCNKLSLSQVFYILVSICYLQSLRDLETATWAFSTQQTADMVSSSQFIAMVQSHRAKTLSHRENYSFSTGQ